jgi:hypothetical protein
MRCHHGDNREVENDANETLNSGEHMSTRTVPKRINDFLVERRGRSYCDACIQERLGLKWRQQVQLITATLAVTDGFERSLDCCCTCQDTKQVILACVEVAPPPRRVASSPILSIPRAQATQGASDDA